MRLHWNGCGLLLHEFCHLIHQFALPNGLENDSVIEAFDAATKSHLYDNTLRRDWAGLECEEDMSYCMVNHKEFFAEISVTLLADAYHHLDLENNTRLEACSPPLMAPTVAERVRSKGYNIMRIDSDSVHASEHLLTPLTGSEQSLKRVATKIRWPIAGSIIQAWQRLSRRDSDVKATIPHCNKFYPFTKGQFEKHDPDLYAKFTDLWTQIGAWHDEATEKPCLRLRSCWPK